MNYLIQSDEELSGIAHRQLGDYLNWKEIADLNGIDIFSPTDGRNVRIPNSNELQSMLTSRVRQLLTQAADRAIESALSNIEATASLPNLDLSSLRVDGRTVKPWQLVSWLS